MKLRRLSEFQIGLVKSMKVKQALKSNSGFQFNRESKIMPHVEVSPEILQWACNRSGLDEEEISKKFEKLPKWISGEIQPTFKQLERFAKAVHIPFGYLFFDNPLDERIPIEDFRTHKGKSIVQPSPNLLETIYICQNRQDWYREHAIIESFKPLKFVGSANVGMSPFDVANQIQKQIEFDISSRENCKSTESTFKLLVSKIEHIGILVMTNGVVMHNTHRPLDLNEFRGFSLSDPLAPLIFINSRDSKSAQLFTLAHELAHIWLGNSALSNIGHESYFTGNNKVERWCNSVSAEILVPMKELNVQIEKSRNDINYLTTGHKFKK